MNKYITKVTRKINKLEERIIIRKHFAWFPVTLDYWPTYETEFKPQKIWLKPYYGFYIESIVKDKKNSLVWVTHYHSEQYFLKFILQH